MKPSRITRLLAVTGAGLLLPGMLATALETGANAATPPHGTMSTVAGGPGDQRRHACRDGRLVLPHRRQPG